MALTPQFGTIVPSQVQEVLQSNYLQWTDNGAANFADFAQQYLPEIYEQEVERYGNRTLSGFLRMVGAELPMTSDQVIWSEQNRLHIAYDNCTVAGNVINVNPGGAADIQNVVSARATVVVMDDFGAEVKALVSVSDPGAATITVEPYTAATIAGAGLVGNVKVFVYGSEYSKGSITPNFVPGGGATSTLANSQYISVDPAFTQFHNNPIIIRNKYVVNGSDMAQIGWVEVATEDGTGGYLWYLKAESETRLRFEDYLEMMCVESELTAVGSAVAAGTSGAIGSQGLFAAIQDRGNVMVGFSAATGIGDFDDILRNLDTQGAIEENMLFLDRQTALDFDDMLANISSGTAGGTAYGLFENSEEMALNLGFSGFRRGSYDFYKTDWKYLNDASTRGGMTGPASIEGVLIPAGTTTVYDQTLGTNIRRPFLHVRYRASQSDDRRMKSWLTGSAGGAFTSDLDAMEVNFLSERCLVTQAANNFVLFQGV
tara:strand:- start:933 stop:2390 length:1458 start_codon:yes stop_codon:yes gene_type:complete